MPINTELALGGNVRYFRSMQQNFCHAKSRLLHRRKPSRAAVAALAFGLVYALGSGNGLFGESAVAGLLIHAPDGKEIVSGAAFPAELSVSDETGDTAARKLLLSAEDIGRYRLIFELQERSAFDQADAEIKKLGDRRLVGHVLAHRYLLPGQKASYADLADWLQRYADTADADRIHDLAVARQPSGRSSLRSPRGRDAKFNGSLEQLAGYRPEAAADAAVPEADAPLSVTPRSRASAAGGTTEDKAEAALQAAKPSIALAQFERDDAGAKSDIGNSAFRSRWSAGLAAWKAKQYDRAAQLFDAIVAARPDEPWFMAEAAYWAGRAHERKGDAATARQRYAAAALYPHTFYGLLATRALGAVPRVSWEVPRLSTEHLEALSTLPAGRRAIGLLQVGRREPAERELRRIDPRSNHLIEEALVALADKGRMAVLALDLGNALLRTDGAPFDAALFPVPNWRPRDGFALDRALVYAVMRQESRFDARLVSNAGASGLMQIMPATASHVRERNEDIGNGGKVALFNPATNLELGQRYIAEILGSPEIDNNLILALAAYNAGPGNLARWRRELDKVKDPLLFIESLPFTETRQYVQKVLANYWLYRQRLGKDTESLDALAAGNWPLYRDAVTQTAEVPR